MARNLDPRMFSEKGAQGGPGTCGILVNWAEVRWVLEEYAEKQIAGWKPGLTIGLPSGLAPSSTKKPGFWDKVHAGTGGVEREAHIQWNCCPKNDETNWSQKAFYKPGEIEK